MKQEGRMIVWPTNLDSSKSRQRGRKIPKGQGVAQPKLAEIERAAATIGLTVETIPAKSSPSNWWDKTGYLVVDRDGKPRTLLLKELAKEVMRLRHEDKEKEKPRHAPSHHS